MTTDPHPQKLISTRLLARLKANGDLDELVPLAVGLQDACVHVSPWTAMRWIRKGSRGVRLEAIKVGGRWLTSRRAVVEFLSAQSYTPDRRPAVPDRPARDEAIRERHGLDDIELDPDASA